MDMPYPPLEPAFVAIVNRALVWAWGTLQQRVSEQDLRDAPEVQITEAMQTLLNQALNDPNEPVAGFSAAYFETMERGAEVTNCDGTRLEKRPDLRFRLRGRRNVSDHLQHAFFVECKIIDATHTVLRYCDEGVVRFIRGDYAWAMPHAMMLGYVRDNKYSIERLKQLLEGGDPRYAVTWVSHAKVDGFLQSLKSTHDREWAYPVSNRRPGIIEIRHMWLFLASKN